MTTWEEYKAISIQTTNSEMRFFKLERGIANISASQFLIASLYRAIGLNETSETEASLYAERLFIIIQNTTKLGKIFDLEFMRINIAKVFGAAGIMIWNYTLYRKFVFREKSVSVHASLVD